MGAVIASTLSDVLDRHAVSLTDRKVLDFGCGPARVASRFKLRYPSCMLFGTDVDAEAIEWARAHVPEAGSFGINGQLPPLSFDDGFFDVVYSVSVFTHLDESSQRLWLRELSRVVKPGGIVMATVHGDAAQASCTEGEISQLQEHGFAFRIGHKGRWKLDGLPDFYQTSFQTREHVKRTWTQWFQLVEHAEGALHGHQDLVVLRRPHR